MYGTLHVQYTQCIVNEITLHTVYCHINQVHTANYTEVKKPEHWHLQHELTTPKVTGIGLQHCTHCLTVHFIPNAALCEDARTCRTLYCNSSTCMLLMYYYWLQRFDCQPWLLTATNKNGFEGWNTTFCTSPFNDLNGICDVFKREHGKRQRNQKMFTTQVQFKL